jgi:hypothetical protein
MATTKTFTIIKTRRDIETPTTGTVAELTEYFGGTLRDGHSYNPKINLAPKTAKGLVSALNKCVSELQRGSYNPNHYALAENN